MELSKRQNEAMTHDMVKEIFANATPAPPVRRYSEPEHRDKLPFHWVLLVFCRHSLRARSDLLQDCVTNFDLTGQQLVLTQRKV